MLNGRRNNASPADAKIRPTPSNSTKWCLMDSIVVRTLNCLSGMSPRDLALRKFHTNSPNKGIVTTGVMMLKRAKPQRKPGPLRIAEAVGPPSHIVRIFGDVEKASIKPRFRRAEVSATKIPNEYVKPLYLQRRVESVRMNPSKSIDQETRRVAAVGRRQLTQPNRRPELQHRFQHCGMLPS